MRRRRHYFQKMPLKFPEMRKMKRNVVMQELVLHDAVSDRRVGQGTKESNGTVQTVNQNEKN